MKVIATTLSILFVAAIPALADTCKYTDSRWWCGSDGHSRYACENGVPVKKDECRVNDEVQLPCNELESVGAWCGGGI